MPAADTVVVRSSFQLVIRGESLEEVPEYKETRRGWAFQTEKPKAQNDFEKKHLRKSKWFILVKVYI